MQATEKLNKVYQTCQRSCMELAELNASTLNNILKNSAYFEKLSQFRKPEDFILAQSELLNHASSEVAKYIQKASQISINAVTDCNQAWMDWIHETVSKAHEKTQETMSKTHDMLKKSKERE